MKELQKTYDPSSFEDRLYKKWNDRGYFKPSDDKNAPSFSIVIPPPNITGQLHMGHALDNTLQDILIRYKRMKGFSTLWVPGTDHASIATEAKIVEAMRKEGVTKEQLGREKFLDRAWDWKAKYGGRIVEPRPEKRMPPEGGAQILLLSFAYEFIDSEGLRRDGEFCVFDVGDSH